MKRMIFFLLALSVFAGAPKTSLAADWPKMTGASNQHHCEQALKIAKGMFQSDVFFLYAPLVIPAKFSDTLVLGVEDLDISGGDSIIADETAFDKLPISGDGPPRSTYWQKKARDGYRLVLREESVGWRGDMYHLYSIGEKAAPEVFLAATTRDKDNSRFIPIISDSWRPPFVFRNNKSGDFWFIYVGEPWEFLADWKVYVSGPKAARPVCTIQFRPSVKNARELLPEPVRVLAVLLDGTMGEGKDEGTLQPTARLRVDVQATWANVALRPWAMREPYNTRKEVDKGLKDWSRAGRSYLKLYDQISRQYPEAEHSLAEYYEKSFHLSPERAKKQAVYALDIAYRSHYAFHSDNDEHGRKSKNPWPRKK